MSVSLSYENEQQFACQNYKIPIQFKCDGTVHCVPDGSDEKDCETTTTEPTTTTTSTPLLNAEKIADECGKEIGRRDANILHSTGDITTVAQEAWAVAIMYQNYENETNLL